jgi:hypothetical protein
MKTFWLLLLLLPQVRFAAGQPPPDTSVTCTKTVSFAVAEGGQPVPAIPKFAAKWIGNRKHVAAFPEVCLSQTPASNTANYIVIFATRESSFDGLTPTAHTYASSAATAGAITGMTSYGGTWNYAYAKNLPATATNSIDLQRIDSSRKVLAVRGYDQQGRQIFHYSLDSSTNREKLLQQSFADIHRDAVSPPSYKRIVAPLSVYYVNCDVDSPVPVSSMVAAERSLASSELKPTSPAPQPQASLELSSDPPGADVYLDDTLIGKTPVTTGVPSGEHVLVMRKADFSLWGRKLHLVAGQRRIVAHLEQKVVNLPPAQSTTKAP